MAHRDDDAALQDKQVQLEQDLARIGDQKRELERASVEEERVAAELEEVRRKLEERRKKFPLLSNLHVASPCNMDWNGMVGDDRVRFCGSCQKNVYNVSALKAEEAEALLSSKEGKPCVRMFKRADGTVLTSDCPVGARRVRLRRVAAGAVVGAGLALTASMALWLQGQAPRTAATAQSGGKQVVSAAARVKAHFSSTRTLGVLDPNDPATLELL
ncbi:hypothetical protein [Polyangium aurulentum]|uniref:hypothetical protein n=1 Tax=Polyangium aurulentum TaxID=2567896 RepID=UPI0010AEBB46|nr:hypothetical protein [Polyangium aurulentum]UQA60968.1 hypothetical protein E8A73_011020 [Polyangium aurulentum]